MLHTLSMVAAILASATTIEVHSATTCPSSEAISASLTPLLSDGADAKDVAWIEAAPRAPDGTIQLRLRLVRPDASVIADRELIVQGRCDEMADTVAAVLATWKAPPPPVIEAVTPAPQAEAPPSSPLRLWLGAGGGFGLVEGATATGNLEILAMRESSHLRTRLAVTAQGSRSRNLDQGDVRWRRNRASLGLGWQTASAPSSSLWRVSADADVLLGWLRASGEGFADNRTQSAVEYGLGVGLRGERTTGAWAFWLDVRTVVWSARQRAVLYGAASNATLPAYDVIVGLGLSRLVFR